jgi:hypothetical protein
MESESDAQHAESLVASAQLGQSYRIMCGAVSCYRCAPTPMPSQRHAADRPPRSTSGFATGYRPGTVEQY